MTILGFVIFAVLSGIAALHVVWGLGIHWPAQNETELADLVVGRAGKRTMPSPVQCFVAAAMIFAAGVVALLVAESLRTPLPRGLVSLAGIGAAAVFLGRGVAGYVPAWRAIFSREPFATMDRTYYSPLCLAIAAGLVWILLERLKV